MNRLFLLACLLCAGFFVVQSSHAAPSTERTPTFQWEIPVTRTDGSALELSEIEKYNLYCGSESGVYDPIQSLAATDESTQVALPVDTAIYCAMTTTDISGLEGPYSNEVTLDAPPGAPVNLIIINITIGI